MKHADFLNLVCLDNIILIKNVEAVIWSFIFNSLRQMGNSEVIMLSWSSLFLIVALIAGVLGFSGIATVWLTQQRSCLSFSGVIRDIIDIAAI